MPEFNTTKNVLTELLEFSKQTAALNLLESGIDTNFVQPILEILNSNVITGANVDDVLDELALFIKGTPEIPGRLERYVGQISRDSLMQFSATYDNVLADELDFQFFRYVGTRIRDTRPFCTTFLGEYFHSKEICELGDGINPLTGNLLSPDLLQGRIKGTTCSNIFTNRGGWNCRHRFTAINTQFVPIDVLQRNIDKGNYTPSEREKQELGLS